VIEFNNTTGVDKILVRHSLAMTKNTVGNTGHAAAVTGLRFSSKSNRLWAGPTRQDFWLEMHNNNNKEEELRNESKNKNKKKINFN